MAFSHASLANGPLLFGLPGNKVPFKELVVLKRPLVAPDVRTKGKSKLCGA
jgi:hypothetical protein